MRRSGAGGRGIMGAAVGDCIITRSIKDHRFQTSTVIIKRQSV
jgi:hypothetical protein